MNSKIKKLQHENEDLKKELRKEVSMLGKSQKREQEKQVVGLMIELYCHGHHGTCGHTLCPDCEALRNYADARVDHCPHMETKTFCSACKTHCYKPQMREAIR